MRDDFSISQLAIPAVSVLIGFLAYSSQYFFLRFEDAPLRRDEVWKINIFALCIWICYFRACYVDPGRLPSDQKSANPDKQEKEPATGRQRWCRRCEAYKPLRAHHCKTCQRLHNIARLLWLKFCMACTNLDLGVFQKWIIIARGPPIACHILLSPTLSVFYSTQQLACPTSRPFSGAVRLLSGVTEIYPV
jgi:hypothetical protein